MLSVFYTPFTTPHNTPAPTPATGAVCCTFFSLSGMIFLFGLSLVLKSDSMYFLMEGATAPKPSYAPPVEGAMYIYLSTMVLSLIFWVRTYTADSIVEFHKPNR